MNRAKCNHVVLHMLLSVLTLATLCDGVAAQTAARNPRPAVNVAAHSTSIAAITKRTAVKRSLTTQHPFYPFNMKALPADITRRKFDPTPKGTRGTLWARSKVHRAPGDQTVVRQTILLSKSDPNAEFSTTPATSKNEHPFWSADEKYIYFDSNRASDTDTTPSPNNTFNIFRMLADGTGIVQMAASTSQNQLDPNISSDGGTLVYVAGGTISFTGGLSSPTTTGFDLYSLAINNGGTPVQLTNAGGPYAFADVRHPSFSPGSDKIAFAGKLKGDTHYHIFELAVSTGVITQMTAGPSNDYSPAFSPDGNLIAFTTNASGFGSNMAPSPAVGTVGNDDIYVISPNPVQLHSARVTNFAVGGVQSSNRNPAWSTQRIDPLGNIPKETDPNGNALTYSEQLLAFGSTRQDTNKDGIANAVGTTSDIYWLHTRIGPVSPGVYTVTTPESAGNVAHKLRTSEPDTAIDPTDPTYNFDPNFVSNEDFPAWPQYQNTYRIAYQSDKGGNLELWGSMILDINAPTLLKYDTSANEIVHVARDAAPETGVREVNAGETVRFRVRAVDYESGVESVYLQIKCPDSLPQSSDNTEHKVFIADSGNALLSQTNYVFACPYEVDAQAVNANSTNTSSAAQFKPNGYNSGATGGIPANWPGGNIYTPGVEDQGAFSGLLQLPDDGQYVPLGAAPGTPPPGAPDRDPSGNKVNLGGFWLRLYDDGPISKGGHEPEGETAGDGVYTAVWQTPPSFPSDWLIDVIVRDMAIDPFNPGAAINWKMYDNVWGFTSKPFQAKSGVLYISDYDTGQKFLGGRFGNFGAGNQGFNFLGLAFNGTPTESWMTEFDPQLFPTLYGPPPLKPLEHFETMLGAHSYGGSLDFGQDDALDFDGSPIPPTQRYDIWRIQCRGPIPNAVLNTYAPHLETQAYDPISGTTPPPVLVAERCVIWHAPYTGDLFVGPGTLLDPSVQVQLQNFVAKGGRLMVQGQDVAWGLTLGGSTPNQFLTQTLHVTYGSDDAFLTPPDALAADQIDMTAADPAGNGHGGLPIGWETWYLPVGHPDYLGPPGNVPDYPPAKANMFMGDLIGQPAQHDFNCPNVGNDIGTPDVVSFPPAQTLVNNVDATFNNTAKSPAIMWWTDTAANSKIVFSPIGWEAICSEYFAANSAFILLNRKTELMHNTLDYLRTGRLIGTVRVINPNGSASSPLGGAVVRATDAQTGKVVASAKTLSDGSYVLNGLYPDGIYGLDAVKKGYVTQHATGGVFHGAYQNKQDFFMTQAQPGGASGVITVFGTGAPVGGAIVTATDTSDPADPNPPTYSSQPSDPKDGSYTINNLPASTYKLTVSNLAAIGYASSVPPSINVTVTQSTIVSGNNFQLKQLPGRVLGKVDIADANGNDTGVPLPNAVVTATGKPVGNNPAEQFTSAKTGADGTFTIPGIDPGPYTLVATAPGYAPNTPINVTVSTNSDTTGIVIALVQIPPGGVAGLISTSTGNTVDGATVTVTDAAGTNYTTTSFNPPKTGTDANGNSYQYNYLVTKVAAGGNVTVTATKPGYTPTPDPDTQTVAIVAGTTTPGVNFTLNPLFSYNADLTLISAPFEWTVNGQPLDVATLLNVPAADVASGAFAFVTWDSTAQKYIYHPTPPADTFHLGRGYFMQDSALGATGSLPLTNPNGATAPKDASGNYLPFNIPLKTGWNMIGMPFTIPVDLSKLQINDGGNLIDVPTAQSGGNPALGAALWTYEHGSYEVVYTLDPYRGYWLRAFRPVTLIVSSGAQQGRGVASRGTRALEYSNNKSSDWKLQLVAQAGTRIAGHSYLGTNRAALDKYDPYKMLTPPSVNPQDVSVNFVHSDWGSKSGNYSVDVRSPSAGSWDFTVNSNIPNTPVTLTWPNLATTGRRDMTLTDLDTGTKFELHTRSSYVIPTGSSTVARHFRLEVSRPSRAALQLTNVDAEQSMPTKGVGAAAANIRYTLTADATVQIRVLNSNGRTVRTLEPGATRAAGDNNTIWDLRNDHGITVPASVYTVEVRAVDASGHVVRQPRTLVITR